MERFEELIDAAEPIMFNKSFKFITSKKLRSILSPITSVKTAEGKNVSSQKLFVRNKNRRLADSKRV